MGKHNAQCADGRTAHKCRKFIEVNVNIMNLASALLRGICRGARISFFFFYEHSNFYDIKMYFNKDNFLENCQK